MTEGKRIAARPITDGSRIKWTLEQSIQRDQSRFRIDWVRFTLPSSSVMPAEVADFDPEALESLPVESRALVLACRDPGAVESAPLLARAGADLVCRLLPQFQPGQSEDKGMDYYTSRCPLLFEGIKVGYVLAGGRASAQFSTVHFNFEGAFCLQLSASDCRAIADLVDSANGWITRADVAIDYFDGWPIEDIPARYQSGQFDVRGKRPTQSENGSWTSGHSRTFNVGKRETGKLFRAYEKGHQLFGPDHGSPWVRFEVEFRNAARVIDVDILRRPGDYFAGAYPFCERAAKHAEKTLRATRIKTSTRLRDSTAEAAATRLCRWVSHTAAPSIVALLKHSGLLVDALLVNKTVDLPARLRGFSIPDIQQAFSKVLEGLAPPSRPSLTGALGTV